MNSKTLEGTGLFMETGIWDIFKLCEEKGEHTIALYNSEGGIVLDGWFGGNWIELFTIFLYKDMHYFKVESILQQLNKMPLPRLTGEQEYFWWPMTAPRLFFRGVNKKHKLYKKIKNKKLNISTS